MAERKTRQDEQAQGELVPVSFGQDMTMEEFHQFIRVTKDEVQEKDIDPYMRVIQQVFSAKTPDDVLTPVEAISARRLVGHALILGGFELNESEFDVGSPAYASMQCTYVGLLPPEYLEHLRIKNPAPELGTMPDDVRLEPGEDCVVNCGHKKVLSQLVMLHQFNKYPYRVVFGERGRSKVSGSPMLTLLKWRSEDEPGNGAFTSGGDSGDNKPEP